MGSLRQPPLLIPPLRSQEENQLHFVDSIYRKTMVSERNPKADNGNAYNDMIDNQSDKIRSGSLSLTPMPPPTTLTSQARDSSQAILSEEESMNDDEEERVSYFLQCFSNISTRTDDRRGDDGKVDADSTTSFQCENSRHEESQGAFETILVDRNDDKTTVVVAPSLLNDNSILQHLRSTLYGTSQRSFDRFSTDDTADESTEGSQGDEETSDDRGSSEQVGRQNCKRKFRQDPMVALFFKFFEFAQTERLKKPSTGLYSIIFLFSHLSDVRSDLEWAQDAAHRRQTGKPYVSWADFYAKDRFQPWFTYAMIVIISFAMVWAFYENDWKVESMKVNPGYGPAFDTLLKVGALKAQLLVEEGKWWLLVTAIFLHTGIIHFVVNIGFFFFLCETIERNHGSLHTAVLFLCSGIVANMFSAIFQPTVVSMGSSGGIFGLLGACLGDIVLNSRFFFLVLEERAQKETLKRKRQRLQKKIKRTHKRRNGVPKGDEEEGRSRLSHKESARELIVWACDPGAIQSRRRWVRFWCYVSMMIDLLLNFSVGLLPFVDNFAHMGGLVFGFFMSLSSLRMLSASSFDYHRKGYREGFGKWCDALRIFALRCGGGLSALFLVCVAIFFLRRSDGTQSLCPSCRYISCIAMPKPWKPNDPANWWICDACRGVHGYAKSQGIGFDEIWTNVDIYCPEGSTVNVDFADKPYKEIEQVERLLPDLCRAHCKAN